MTGRSVPEWVGSSPDAKVPPRVRQRIFERFRGRCYLSGIEIAGKPWQIEHVKPLHMGGEHRETNLAPALAEHHAIKTAAEMKRKAKADRAAKRASGARGAPAKKLEGPGFRPSGRRAVHPIPLPPRRSFYREA